jgi:hypothetical protein
MSNISTNPYKGLKTYQETDALYFYGRKSEILTLFEQVVSRKNTVISGMSGSGKSSLINAGLIPVLKDNGFVPIKLTPNEVINESPMDIWDAFCNKIDNAVSEHKLQAEQLSMESGDESKLIDELIQYRYTDEFRFDVSFVFIIDQFEEIFQNKFNLKDIDRFLSAYQKICTKTSQLNHKFIISVRQDYLFEVDRYSIRFPLLQQNRFHLAILNEEQAYEVITAPTDKNGNPIFTEENATQILKDLLQTSDFIRDGIPEQEVDAMLLSLYLYQSVESIIGDNSTKLPNPEDILNKFYSEHMEFDGSYNLEQRLISDSGLYRISITLKDALSYLNGDQSILDSLLNIGILNISSKAGIEYVELHHDRLCKCASHHIAVSQAKEKNALRFCAQSYLSIKNRVLHENSYWFLTHGFVEHNSYSKLKTFIISNFKEFKSGLTGDFSSLFSEAKDAHSYSVVVKLSSKFGYADRSTYDGISQFELKYVKGLLYSISMRGSESENIAIYTGTSTYRFYYDKFARLTLIEMLDVNGEKQIVQDGYSSILYIYNSTTDKLPNKTYYLDLPFNFLSSCTPHSHENFTLQALQFAVRHLEGNHGYSSYYNSYGCEEERVFLDSTGHECVLSEGFSRIKFSKTSSDEIIRMSFFNHEKPTVNIQGIHTIEIEHPNDGSGIITHNYDAADNPISDNEGIFGSKIIVDYCELTVTVLNLDDEGNLKETNEQVQIQKNWMDSKYNFIRNESYNSEGTIVESIFINTSKNGLVNHSRVINNLDIRKSQELFIAYDEKCRPTHVHEIGSTLSETKCEFTYDDKGNYKVVTISNSATETEKKNISEATDHGSKRRFPWGENLFITLDMTKDGKYTQGHISDEDGNIIEDPDYGASLIEIKDKDNISIRTFYTKDKKPVLKEYLKNDQILRVEVFYNGNWKIRTQELDEGFVIWDTDYSGRFTVGNRCNSDGTPLQVESSTFDKIECQYEGDGIVIRTFSLNGIPQFKIIYNKTEANELQPVKEYRFIDGTADLTVVKYYDSENTEYYKYIDESQLNGDVRAELNGIHQFTEISGKDSQSIIRTKQYLDKAGNLVNGQDNWAKFAHKVILSESPYQRTPVQKAYFDFQGNWVNAAMDFDNQGAYEKLEFIQNYFISFTLSKVMPNGRISKIIDATPKRLGYFKRRKFFKEYGLIDYFKDLDIPLRNIKVEQLNEKMTVTNAGIVSFEAIKSYLITTSTKRGELPGYIELLFVNKAGIIHREKLHYPTTKETESVIMITEAFPQVGWNLKNNDIILNFGNWNFFELREKKLDITEAFIEIFEEWLNQNKGVINLTIARNILGKWHVYSGIIKYVQGTTSIGKIQDASIPIAEVSAIQQCYSMGSLNYKQNKDAETSPECQV